MSDERFNSICQTIIALAVCALIASCQWSIVANNRTNAEKSTAALTRTEDGGRNDG